MLRTTLVLAVVATLAPSLTVHAQSPFFEDGFESGDFSVWASAVGLPEPTTYRFSDLDLRDPHLFVDVPVFGCSDFTDDDIAGIVPSLNEQLETSITTDGNGDGLLDTSILIQMHPRDLSGASHVLESRRGLCTDPMATTSCTPDPASSSAYASYRALDTGFCLEPLPGTTGGYIPSISLPVAVCFVSTPTDLVIGNDGIELPLQASVLAATFVGEPPVTLHSGLLMGFLSEDDANAVRIPDDFPLVGGQPISTMIPGGAGNCAGHDDRDTFDSTSGWWFYFNFEAEEVPFSGR